MRFGPGEDARERSHDWLTEWRERVFDARRPCRVDGPHDEPVALHAPQGLRQHLMRDAADPTLQLAVVRRAGGQHADDHRGPAIGESLGYLAGRRVGIEDAGRLDHSRDRRAGYSKVPTWQHISRYR